MKRYRLEGILATQVNGKGLISNLQNKCEEGQRQRKPARGPGQDFTRGGAKQERTGRRPSEQLWLQESAPQDVASINGESFWKAGASLILSIKRGHGSGPAVSQGCCRAPCCGLCGVSSDQALRSRVTEKG